VDKQFWLERWQRREIGWHRTDVNAHLQEYWPRLGIQPPGRVFVPLCGKTLDLLWLMQQGYHVVGVELSEQAISEFFDEHHLIAHKTTTPSFISYHHDHLTLLCGDFFDLTPSAVGTITALFDRAALTALPPEMRVAYRQHLQQLIPFPVPTLLITFQYDQTRMKGPPFSIQDDELDHLFAQSYQLQRMASYEVVDDAPLFRAHGLTTVRENIDWLQPIALCD
jgi:thiopurine S-methyltransferase